MDGWVVRPGRAGGRRHVRRLVAAADEASDRAALAQARESEDSAPWEQVKVDLPEGSGACLHALVDL